MAANLLPWIALGGLALLAMRKDEAAPATVTTAAPPPPTPPPTPPVGVPPGTTFPTPGFVPPLPAGIPSPPPPPPVVVSVSPGEEFLPCHYHMLRRFPGLPDEAYRVITLPPQLFIQQRTIYEGVLRTWFQSVPLLPGQWTLVRNCDGFNWIVVDTRNVLMVA